jgi:hypothetical protein
VLEAKIDPALGVRVLSTRELRYSDTARLGDDRPAHVRAASGLAFANGRLAVIQDDCAFIAMVAGQEVASMMLPRGAGGRRRFEVGLGNKMEKLDLESVVAIGDDLFAFGSGSSPPREKVVHVGYGTKVLDARPLFSRLREEVGGAVNIEGVALVAGKNKGAPTRLTPVPPEAGLSGALTLWPDVTDESNHELWLFHRGNTGPKDRGPQIIRYGKTPLLRWLLGNGPVPDALATGLCDLGSIDGVRIGFTDAVGAGERVYYIAAAEDSPNAIDDGKVLGAQIGVIESGRTGRQIRAANLVVDGVPVKAEGLAFDPTDPRHAWLAIDSDDVEVPSRLVEVELTGPW